MNVDFTCPECETRNTAELAAGSDVACDRCNWSRQLPEDFAGDGPLTACPVCRCPHLYWKKDFPAKLGLGIVVIGFAISCITWNMYLPIATFVVLFATGLLDLVVYLLVGEVLVCYRCRALYRGVVKREGEAAFDLAVAERYRQEQRRMRSNEERIP
jgi:uncharacterized protein YbaR (Trm112 family)